MIGGIGSKIHFWQNEQATGSLSMNEMRGEVTGGIPWAAYRSLKVGYIQA